jgi:hypothetical protein
MNSDLDLPLNWKEYIQFLLPLRIYRSIPLLFTLMLFISELIHIWHALSNHNFILLIFEKLICNQVNLLIIFKWSVKVSGLLIIKYNLSVAVPPEKLIIMDDKGTNIPHHILGPYNEGSSVNITCIATGGKSSVGRISLVPHYL